MDSQSKEFGRAVQRGTRLMLFAQVASQLISLLVIAALYRLVERESFGLMGMLVPLLMLLRVLTTQGLGVATIQEKTLDDEKLDALFWLAIGFGMVATIVVAMGSVGLASLYDAPSLVPVGLLVAGTSLVAALGSQHQALLERNLRFDSVIRIRIVGQLSGGLAGVGSAFVFSRIGVWGVLALIIQQYVELGVISIGCWWREPWRPGRPKRMSGVGSLVRFGGFYGGANLVFFMSRNIDKIILSLAFGGTPAGRALIGMYSQAFNQMMKPVQLATSPLIGILLPALSKAREQQRIYEDLVERFFLLATLFLAPATIGLFVVAVDGFRLLGGDEWIDAGRMLETMALAIAAQGLINMCGSLYASRGRAKNLFYGSIVVFGALFVGFTSVAYILQQAETDSLTVARGIGWSFTCVTLLICAPYVIVCLRLCNVSRRRVGKKLLFPVAMSVWMGVITWTLREILERTSVRLELRLLIVIASGVVFYLWLTRDVLRSTLRDVFSGSTNHEGQGESDAS